MPPAFPIFNYATLKEQPVAATPTAPLAPDKFAATMGAAMPLLQGHFISTCLYSCALLDVATIIGSRGVPLSAGEIAEEVQKRAEGAKPTVHVDALQRQLRLLSQVGVFEESQGPKFALTDFSNLLRTDQPQPCLRWAVLSWSEPPFMAATGKLPDLTALAGGTQLSMADCPFTYATGSGVFEYYQAHPESGVPFDKFMTTFSAPEIPSTLAWPGWTELPKGSKVCDLGGGLGHVGLALKEQYPDLEVTVVDQPPVVAKAEKTEKVTFLGGDFFNPAEIPKSDVIYMKHIIHDWNDEASAKILKGCWDALPVGGKVLIVDAVLPEPGEKDPAMAGAFFIDFVMLLIGSKERTKAEFQTLMEAAGFKLDSITPSPQPNGQMICGIKQ